MQNQESNAKQVVELVRQANVIHSIMSAMDRVGELQFSRPETETSSRTASSNLADSRATHQASQSRNSECTAVPKNPENGVNTVPKTVNLATFEDRIAALEWRLSSLTTQVGCEVDRLERLEDKLQTYMATSDKTLADRVQQSESACWYKTQEQMGIGSEAWIDLEAPSSNLSSQSAHCSEKLSTQSTDHARAKTSSRRDISWAEFDRAYTATLATVRLAAASTLDKLIATGWLQDLRMRLKNLTDKK